MTEEARDQHGFGVHAGTALQARRVRTADEQLLLLEERDRIAAELYDSVMRDLFGLGLTISSLTNEASDAHQRTRLAECVDALDGVIERIRSAVFDMRAEP